MSTITETPTTLPPVFVHGRPRPARRPIGAVLATLGALVALIGGGILLAHAFTADSDGYYSTGEERLSTQTYALTAEDMEVAGPGWLVDGLAGTVRVEATPTGTAPVFVGIARQADVDRYLGGVARAEVEDAGLDSGAPRYAERGRGAPLMAPDRQRFWAASAHGAGAQAVTWTPAEGRWAVVVMNADGSRAVAVDVRAGAELPWLLPAGWITAIAGLVVLAGGIALYRLPRRGH